MIRKRSEATRIILASLKRGPAFPKQLSDELNLPLSTVNHNLRKVLSAQGLDLIKQLPDGRYAVKEYSSEEERVRNAHDQFQRRLARSPKPEEIAYLIKESPSAARDLLYKYIPDYHEPSEDEIKKAADLIWNYIFWGAEIEYPDPDQRGITGTTGFLWVHMDEDVVLQDIKKN